MSKPILYIRNPVPPKRSDASLHKGFSRHGEPFSSYSAAVLAGQQLGGYGNFYVYLGESSFPSREDQLLLEPRPRRGRRRLSPELLDATLLD